MEGGRERERGREEGRGMLLLLCILSVLYLVENITAGSIATAVVKVGGFPFQNQTYDVCSSAMHLANLKCPISTGQHSVTVTIQVPIMTPRVRFVQKFASWLRTA